MAWLDRLSGARKVALAWTLLVVAVATVVYWPALQVGYLADDLYQIALHDGVAGTRPPWALYSLFELDPAATSAHMAGGSLPWWTVPEFKFVQLRPLSSLLLALDHTIRPHDAVAHHLHSMLWMASTVVAAHYALRRATTPVIAGLALGLFAIDETLGWTIAWVANRCSLVAATFAFLALALHLRRTQTPSRRLAFAELGAWSLAFAAGEYALCGLAYLIAYAMVGRTDGWRVRLRALAPAALALALFSVVYVMVRAGVLGATSYIDPLSHPGELLIAAADRIPRMLGETWLTFPSESERLLSRFQGSVSMAWLMVAAGIDSLEQLVPGHGRMVLMTLPPLVLVSGWLARPYLEPNERRAVAWLALGSVGAVVPLTAIMPTTRALALAGLGPAVFIASLAVAATRAVLARPVGVGPRLRAVVLAVIAVPWVGAHTVNDAKWARKEIEGLSGVEGAYRRFHFNQHTEGVTLEGKHVVVISTPGLVTGLHARWMMHLWGEPMPATWHVLTMGGRRLFLRRFDRSTLELSTIAGRLLDQPQESLFRPPSADMRLHDVASAGLFDATVVREAPTGGPSAVQFRFRWPLDDPRLVFLVAGSEGLRPLALPPVGGAKAIAPPLLPGLDPNTPSPR
ncbi:MAG: hypothetical protein AAF799_02120 [Myxococcota bacterium]